MASQVMPALDPDFAVYLKNYLEKKEVNLALNDSVIKLEGDSSAHSVILKRRFVPLGFSICSPIFNNKGPCDVYENDS